MTQDDHLVLVFDQRRGESGADLTLYFSCIPKGRVHMPLSLREMIEKVKHSKVKIYHGSDIELTVSTPRHGFTNNGQDLHRNHIFLSSMRIQLFK